ncbi:hypothetical protein AQPE_2931 [Aquipluma nitroreducens]|uniref:Outer membrane protein beta-barrel domain-containing protein n=2 Tax=Aquipluma nitroreducens TaxID=2010828 RepID=A0A5K7SBC5_9BACT|nr:hypothetical protein AQPE_2931 [Aquipluma nitroreducens]
METSFTIGVILPKHSIDHSIDAELGSSLKLGFNQSWYNPENKFSFRPDIGINLERLAVDNIGYGGLGGGSSWKGSILSINLELATLAQFKLAKGLFFALGPSGKYLITNYENLTRSWWASQQAGGVEKTHEFNRKYFLKPSFGLKAMIMKKDLCKKISLGLSFEYQWRNYKEYREINTFEEIIQYSQTSEISLHLGLH